MTKHEDDIGLIYDGCISKPLCGQDFSKYNLDKKGRTFGQMDVAMKEHKYKKLKYYDFLNYSLT